MLVKIIEDGITFDDVLIQPRRSDVTPDLVSVATRLTKDICIRSPIISSPMDTVTEEEMARAMSEYGGIGIIHRNMEPEAQVSQIKNILGYVGAAVGVGEKHYQRAEMLADIGVNVIVIDCAHGHSTNAREMVRFVKSLGVQVIAGNVATGDGADFLIQAGVDAIKVGIGPGSICTTRIVSGVGVPQITAILNVVKIAKPSNIPVIADGGIRTSGDIVKAFVAGAESVMIGNLFAGTDETPGSVIYTNGRHGPKYKVYRGMGSAGAMSDGSSDRYGGNGSNKLVPEGVESKVLCKGPVKDILEKLEGGIRSGMGYCGVSSICDLYEFGKFIRITNAGQIESHPHDLK